jgi:hypothetical protein
MSMPGFTADASLRRGTTTYPTGDFDLRQTPYSHAGKIIPAIPACRNCDYILDRCAQNGGRPRAVCNACATGDCFSGVENPPPRPPWETRPPWFF